MINRECGVYQTTYEGDMALYPLPLARYSTLGAVAILVLLPFALDSHAMSLANLMLLASIGAIGLNILVGYTGQVLLRDTTGVEGPHRELRARLADGLRRDDPHRGADFDQPAASQVPTVALRADAQAQLTGIR